ncbi:MAG: tetratricopeptide repeat protein [Phycisphaerae bacterium]
MFGGSATGAQHGGIGGTHHGPSVSFSAGLLTDHAVVGIHLGDGHHDTTHGLALGLLGTAHFGHSGFHHGFGHFPHYGYTAYYPYNSYYYSGYDPYYYPSRAYYRYDTYVDRFYDNDLYYADTAVGRGDGYVGAAWYEPPDQEQVVPEPDSTYAAPPSPIQALLEQGHDAFRRGAYEEARSRYVRAILADEAGGVAKLFYGFANVALGDYEQAAVAFRRALIATPELIDTPPDLRDLYRDDDRLTAHITDLAAFFAAHPESRDALFVLGYMHYAAADPVAALDAFTALCDADPSDDVVMLLRHAARRAVRHAAPSP